MPFSLQSPVMEDAGIDEAFLEVSDIANIDRPAIDIAQEIKQKVKEETGLTCIRKTAFFCLGNFELKNKKVRLVGVRIGGLVKI